MCSALPLELTKLSGIVPVRVDPTDSGMVVLLTFTATKLQSILPVHVTLIVVLALIGVIGWRPVAFAGAAAVAPGASVTLMSARATAAQRMVRTSRKRFIFN